MTLPPWNAKLRDWQTRAVGAAVTHQTQDFLATATPAAGKTRFALRIAHQYLADRAASRVLVICPTNHLRTQWSSAAGLVGIQLDPALTNDQAMEARDYHGAVVTYQQVCLAPDVFRRACRSKPTLLIFDELHHAGDGKDWGNALRDAFAEARFRLALSGTPFRSDNNPIPYVRYERGESQADFTYSYAQAIREGVCRPILFPSYEGELTWLSGGREHRATFEDGLRADRQRERLKTALLQETWLGPVIADAHGELTRLRKQEQPDAGGLIVAMNQDHARQVADLVKRVTGTTAEVAVSDDPSASQTIETFSQHRKQQWLVAVNMVSEGVDIPRLRVGVYATNVLTELYFRQVVGRFVRMQEGLPKPQRAWLYLPKDATLVHYAKQIKAERDHVLEDVMPAVQRTLFGTVATSLNEYVPLHAVARMDALIGGESDEAESHTEPVRAVALHERKIHLRDIHRDLVASIARKTGMDHRLINAELIKRTGCRVDQATVPQLERRIAILERWRDQGYDGPRR
ncbi:MAG: DEAD/DEAH box helicase family protein [Nitrospiraceae bacterium]